MSSKVGAREARGSHRAADPGCTAKIRRKSPSASLVARRKLRVATRLVRGGTDLVIVADLLGHARLETTRVYTGPTGEDRAAALDLLDVDE